MKNQFYLMSFHKMRSHQSSQTEIFDTFTHYKLLLTKIRIMGDGYDSFKPNYLLQQLSFGKESGSRLKKLRRRKNNKNYTAAPNTGAENVKKMQEKRRIRCKYG